MIRHLLPDEATLRALLPNIQTTVRGETDIFAKMQPFIAEASESITTLFDLKLAASLPEETLTAMLAVKSMELAAPSLDCVLTPNGFAVVFNQTMMPSAKIQGQKPLDRLLESLSQRFFALSVQLVSALLSDGKWCCSTAARVWTKSVFNPDSFVRTFKLESLEQVYALRPQLDYIQTKIQDCVVGEDLMKRLYSISVSSEPAKPEELQLLFLVRSAVSSFFKTTTFPKHITDRIAHLLIAHLATFPEWEHSAVGQMWLTPPDFSNDKKSSGYFF